MLHAVLGQPGLQLPDVLPDGSRRDPWSPGSRRFAVQALLGAQRNGGIDPRRKLVAVPQLWPDVRLQARSSS